MRLFKITQLSDKHNVRFASDISTVMSIVKCSYQYAATKLRKLKTDDQTIQVVKGFAVESIEADEKSIIEKGNTDLCL